MTDYRDAHRDAMAAVQCEVNDDTEGVMAVLNNASNLAATAQILAIWQAGFLRYIASESGAPVQEVLAAWRRNEETRST